MRLVTWNCAMALEKKHHKLLALDADVSVIQECSRSFAENLHRTRGWTTAWFGENPHKGLAVLAHRPWKITKSKLLKPKWTARLTIDGPATLELFAVWAHVTTPPRVEYIEQVHLLLDAIEREQLPPLTMVVGDFNSNARWDRDYGGKSHTAAVDRFLDRGMKSAYHEHFGHRHGAEKHPTQWHRKNKSAHYHVDYAFLSEQLLSKLKKVEVGNCEEWLTSSDHAPVIIDIGAF